MAAVDIFCAVPEKNPYPSHGRSSEIPRGRGVLEAKILEAKYEAKLKFPGGGGGEEAKQKPSGGGGGAFTTATSLYVKMLCTQCFHLQMK